MGLADLYQIFGYLRNSHDDEVRRRNDAAYRRRRSQAVFEQQHSRRLPTLAAPKRSAKSKVFDVQDVRDFIGILGYKRRRVRK